MVIPGSTNVNPIVSIIVPCYNQAIYLVDCIESILTQTYTDWECIIVNDGSLDNTSEIAKQYCNKDNRFKLIEKQNGGLSSARNAGINAASGLYIQFLDADDIILIGKLHAQVNSMLQSGAEVSICDYKKVERKSNRELPTHYVTPFVKKNLLEEVISNWEFSLSVPCHCVIFKTSLLTKKHIRFNETLPNHEDWAFWVELFLETSMYIQVNEVFCVYYISQNSMTANKTLMNAGFIKAGRYLIKKIKGTQENLALIPLIKGKIKDVNKRNNKNSRTNLAKKYFMRKLKYLRFKISTRLKAFS